MGLLFERFLSPARDGYPDIDLDIESGRREEVIQYVYRPLRAGLRRPGGQRDHLPAALGGPRHREGAGVLTRPAGRVEQADRALARAGATRPLPEGMPEQVVELADAAAGLPPAPGHPLRRHGDLRPAGLRGGAGGVGPDGGPHRRPVGQGRLRVRRAGQVRPARAGHAHRAAPDASTWSPSTTARRSSCTSCSPPTPTSTRCCSGPTRSGCSRWSRARRWPRCPG